MGQLLRVLVVLFSVVAAMASATKPAEPTTPIARTASSGAGFDATWSAVVDVFADHNWAITTIDKASGIIATDWMNAGADGERFADCGSAPMLHEDPIEARFNVRVKGDAADATMTVNVSFRRTRSLPDRTDSHVVQCNTRGVVEALIQDEALATARRATRRRAIATDAGVAPAD